MSQPILELELSELEVTIITNNYLMVPLLTDVDDDGDDDDLVDEDGDDNEDDDDNDNDGDAGRVDDS